MITLLFSLLTFDHSGWSRGRVVRCRPRHWLEWGFQVAVLVRSLEAEPPSRAESLSEGAAKGKENHQLLFQVRQTIPAELKKHKSTNLGS